MKNQMPKTKSQEDCGPQEGGQDGLHEKRTGKKKREDSINKIRNEKRTDITEI